MAFEHVSTEWKTGKSFTAIFLAYKAMHQYSKHTSFADGHLLVQDLGYATISTGTHVYSSDEHRY